MRPISDNVIKITSDLVDEYASSREIAQTVIQAYLTECWQVFDRDDESTHPKDTGIRIVRDDTNFPDVAKFEDGKWHDLYGNIVFDDEVVAYLVTTPQDTETDDE